MKHSPESAHSSDPLQEAVEAAAERALLRIITRFANYISGDPEESTTQRLLHAGQGRRPGKKMAKRTTKVRAKKTRKSRLMLLELFKKNSGPVRAVEAAATLGITESWAYKLIQDMREDRQVKEVNDGGKTGYVLVHGNGGNGGGRMTAKKTGKKAGKKAGKKKRAAKKVTAVNAQAEAT